MKLFFTIATLLGLSFAAFNDCAIILSFTVNRGYIASHLCEQRAIPGNTCRGCCQLKKRLNDTNRKDTAIPAQSFKEHNDLQAATVETDDMKSLLTARLLDSFDLQLFIPNPPSHTIDHPPQRPPIS